MDYEIENDVIFFLLSRLSLVQVQQVPLNLSIFGKGTMEPFKFPRIESVNLQEMHTLELSILRPSDSPGYDKNINETLQCSEKWLKTIILKNNCKMLFIFFLKIRMAQNFFGIKPKRMSYGY